MRTTVSLMLTLVLISFVAICPSMACPLNASAQTGGCCHKSHQPHDSCHGPVVDCPYLILEKGKTAVGLSQTLAPPQSSTLPVLVKSLANLVTPASRVPDSADLFLRIRMLLI